MRMVVVGAACLMLAHSFSAGPFELSLVATAQAQSVPKSLEQGGTDAAMRVSRNAWTVGVVGGQLSGTYMTFASELAEVLDDADNLRVLPIVTYGAASNLDDLLLLVECRCRCDPSGRIRLFPDNSEDSKSRISSELHPAFARFGDACAGAERDKSARGFARQEGQFWAGGKCL